MDYHSLLYYQHMYRDLQRHNRIIFEKFSIIRIENLIISYYINSNKIYKSATYLFFILVHINLKYIHL